MDTTNCRRPLFQKFMDTFDQKLQNREMTGRGVVIVFGKKWGGHSFSFFTPPIDWIHFVSSLFDDDDTTVVDDDDDEEAFGDPTTALLERKYSVNSILSSVS